MKIYREPAPDDEWNDNWNPDKREQSDLPDEQEVTPTEEVTLSKPTRQSAKTELLKRLEDEKKTPYDEFVEIYKLMEAGAKYDDSTWNKPKINSIHKSAKKLVELIETEHEGEIWEPHFPLKWMIYDDIIYDLLKRYRISDVLNAIDQYRWLYPVEDIAILYKGKYKYAAFMTDADFYERMKPIVKLGMTTLQKYIAALCKVGALVLIEKRGQYSIPVYSSGYYTDYPRYIRFLTQKNKEKFRKFVLV